MFKAPEQQEQEREASPWGISGAVRVGDETAPASEVPPEPPPRASAPMSPFGIAKPATLTAAADPSSSAATAGAVGAAAGGGGVLPWLAPIASAIAGRQQENAERQSAKADMAGKFASQFDFPMYGYEGKRRGRAITNRHGGMGLGSIGKMMGK